MCSINQRSNTASVRITRIIVLSRTFARLMARIWEVCYVTEHTIGIPACNADWVKLFDGNGDRLEKNHGYMHVIPPTGSYPMKYNLKKTEGEPDRPHYYFVHCQEAHPPSWCREVPRLVLNIDVNATAVGILKVKLWNAITGNCLLVMELSKALYWKMQHVEREAKRLLADADRFSRHTTMKVMRSGDTKVLRGNAVIWSPHWKGVKSKHRLGIKTSPDQLKLTHFFGRASSD